MFEEIKSRFNAGVIIMLAGLFLTVAVYLFAIFNWPFVTDETEGRGFFLGLTILIGTIGFWVILFNSVIHDREWN